MPVDDVALAAQGDTGAFERIYHAHLGRVHNLARRMAGPEAAHELTQDVFVRVWQKLSTFRGEASFTTWLHRLAVNVIIERFRTLGTARERFLADGETVLERMPAASTARHDARMDLDQAMKRLPQGARAVFVLHDIEGYRHEEIGNLLGVSVGTSKSQLHRARMTLRTQLTQGPPASALGPPVPAPRSQASGPRALGSGSRRLAGDAP
ncbi:MAG TPA: RNA polymerase sigma factor [Vicinamibacterales bacterium]|nr:RNA polymerase sigma factor [Vicinamibacterales bacterium]